jgi:HlyD family secretion protein
MKTRLILITGTAVILAVVLIALRSFTKKNDSVSFETVKVQKGSISNTVTATGTIQAIKSITVGTQVSGIIQHIYVDFNDKVRKGQILAKLDSVPLKSQLDQSRSAVDQAQAQLTFEEANHRRLKILYDKNLISQSDYDQAVFNYENSKAAVSNAKSAYARSKVNLDYATIISPIEGVVLNRAVEEGQTVAASFNTPTLFTIVNDVTQMQVQTSVDEADIGKVMEGQRVEFTVEAYPDMKFNGTVSQVRLQPVTTNNVVTYVVIMKAPNPEGKLMPGMTASTTIYVEEKKDALFISGKTLKFKPSASYTGNMLPGKMPGPGMKDMKAPEGMPPMPQVTNLKSRTVWIRDTVTGLKPAMIITGIDNGSYVEVVSGLNENDEVVVSVKTSGKTADAASKKSNNGPRGPFPF